MEEDIKILEEFIKDYEATTDPLEQSAYFEEVPAKTIRNIITKYKEQEEHIKEYKLNVKEAMYEAQENARIFRKEQEKANKYKKMVELMAKDIIVENKLDEDICRQVKDPKKEECYTYMYDEKACIDCVIEYYEKKAKGEST